jgi:hypothetical protein
MGQAHGYRFTWVATPTVLSSRRGQTAPALVDKIDLSLSLRMTNGNATDTVIAAHQSATDPYHRPEFHPNPSPIPSELRPAPLATAHGV